MCVSEKKLPTCDHCHNGYMKNVKEVYWAVVRYWKVVLKRNMSTHESGNFYQMVSVWKWTFRDMSRSGDINLEVGGDNPLLYLLQKGRFSYTNLFVRPLHPTVSDLLIMRQIFQLHVWFATRILIRLLLEVCCSGVFLPILDKDRVLSKVNSRKVRAC